MRLVAIGLLAATLFGAGCALQPGDPGEATGTSPELAATPTPKFRAATTPQGASSSTPPPPNPEPSPWMPVNPMDPSTTGTNPEPSPWNQGLPSYGQGGTQAGNTGGGTGSGSEGHAVHLVGHRDARSGDLQ